MPFALSRRHFIHATGAATAAAALGPNLAFGAAKGAPAIRNPLVRQRADAQVFRSEDGWYYMTGSVPEYDRLVLRRARTLAGLTDAHERVLWRHLKSGPLSGFIWAPEMHRVNGQWIMYFAAGPSGGGEDVFRIRTWAVACKGDDPMTGEWSVLGQFKLPWDSFNLDSTMFDHAGTRYFCWAQREKGIETNSNLYLAPLAGPLTLAAKPVRLSVPTLPWEIQGFKVNEGAAILQRNGRVFLTYSASATDARYCLGMLTADADADLMRADAWTKSPAPVFVSSDVTQVYGPGHNSFTVDENGRDMLVYHGRDYEKIEGDPLFDPNRHTRTQRLYYNADGTPDFGIPVGNGVLPDRLSPLGRPDSFAYNSAGRGMVGTAPLPATQMRQIPGLAGGDTVSLAPITAPDHVLAWQADGLVEVAPKAAGKDFAARASFHRKSGLAGEGVSFAAPSGDRYLAARGDRLIVTPIARDARRSASFTLS